MAEFKTYDDPAEDPGKNDDSQPSVTTVEQVLRESEKRTGVKPSEAGIPAPADAVDLAYRTAIADTDAHEVGKAVAAAAKGGVPPEAIDVESAGEGGDLITDDADDVGTGHYEGRTGAQLKAALKAKGLATSGTKDELVERLRG